MELSNKQKSFMELSNADAKLVEGGGSMDSYNHHSFGQCDVDGPNFRAVAQVGTKAPDFALTDLDGKRVALLDFRGKKHVILEFGSTT